MRLWHPPVSIVGGFCTTQTAHVYVPPVLLSGLGEAAGISLALLSRCSAGLLRFCCDVSICVKEEWEAGAGLGTAGLLYMCAGAVSPGRQLMYSV